MKDDKLTEKIEYGQEKLVRIIPEENLNKLVDRFQFKHYRLATRLIYQGGLRPVEALELTWQDLEQKENHWKAEITTGLADRTVVLKGEKLDKLLKEFVEEEGDIFNFEYDTFASQLCRASNGEIQPYTLRRSKEYHLISEENPPAERLRDELGLTLSTAEQRASILADDSETEKTNSADVDFTLKTDSEAAEDDSEVEMVNVSEDYDVYIGRSEGFKHLMNTPPGERGWLGNPFRVDEFGRQKAVDLYEKMLKEKLENYEEFRQKFKELEGKKLGGKYEEDELYHGDIIFKILEEQEELRGLEE